jgi:hypothetical protein
MQQMSLPRIESLKPHRLPKLTKIHWVWECHDVPVTAEMAQQAQHRSGYPVRGYGFFGFECIEDLPGKYTARWSCWSSCD